jgi:hypothetical protein
MGSKKGNSRAKRAKKAEICLFYPTFCQKTHPTGVKLEKTLF